jgi:hypothetical protein
MNRFFSFSKQRTNINRVVPTRQPIVGKPIASKPIVRRPVVRRPASSFQRNLIDRLRNPASCGCGK